MESHDRALSKAEFYLCLAQAFAVPDAPGAREAFAEALPADLEALAGASGYSLARAGAALREAMARVPDREHLLRLYSRLFLVPGEAHPSLNAGVYLDGGIAGGTLAALEACLARCGLERDQGFRDLADHIAVQMELLAVLFAVDAQADPQTADRSDESPRLAPMDLVTRFVGRWVGPFRHDLEQFSVRFGLPENPYLVLARALESAVMEEVRCAPQDTPAESIDPEIARLRRELAGRTLTEEDLAIIRQRLAADGLPYGHVAIPIEARDRTMGLSTMIPPSAPSHRRHAVSES